MIKVRARMFLDGRFAKAGTAPERFSTRTGDQWAITVQYPKSVQIFDVVEFDEKGEKWLLEHERKDTPPPTTEEGK